MFLICLDVFVQEMQCGTLYWILKESLVCRSRASKLTILRLEGSRHGELLMGDLVEQEAPTVRLHQKTPLHFIRLMNLCSPIDFYECGL